MANTSDREWTASDTMAPDMPKTPANSLKAASATFPKMPTRDSFRMILCSSMVSLPAFFVIRLSILPAGV